MKIFNTSERLNHLPFYLYPTIDAAMVQAKKRGLNIIDLSLGEADFSTPEHIAEALRNTCTKPEMQRYGNIQGYPPLRTSIANWYKKRFGVDLDSETEIITFVGSKEGIAFLPLAFIDSNDLVLIPDPGYPTYRYAASFAGAKLQTFPILPDNEYKPDFNKIPRSVAENAKIMFLNYPNNPTGATVDNAFFESTVSFAKKYNIIICHDAAYSEVTYDGYRAPSFLEAKEAKEVGIEFHTLSKTFCMTGWRVGFCVGNNEIIRALLEVKRVTSSGCFTAVEAAGAEALNSGSPIIERNNQELKERRDFMIRELNRIGIYVAPPKGSFYIWFAIPKVRDSLNFVTQLILKTGVVSFPGIGYGENGEGYIRIALTQNLPKLQEAFIRMEPYLRS
jgi:LL-diaminopimelate aminotransferase